MEADEVRSRVAVAVGLKLGVDNTKARIVGDAVLRVIQECGLITVVASDLAKVNHLMAVGIAQNMKLREALSQIERETDCGCNPCVGQCRSEAALREELANMREVARDALADPDAIVIEGESTPVAHA